MPDGKLDDKGEGPDFLIEHSSGVLGVEHTKVFKKHPTSKKNQPAVREGTLSKIIAEAQKLAERSDLAPLLVNVWFDRACHHKMKRERRDKLSHQLFEVVSEWITKNKSSNYSCIKPEMAEISHINITRTQRKKHLWSKEGAGWAKKDICEEIQEEINKKNKKYKKYKAKCDQCWLLIVADQWNVAQCIDVNEVEKNLEEMQFTSNFEKVFFLERTIPRLIKLSILK